MRVDCARPRRADENLLVGGDGLRPDRKEARLVWRLALLADPRGWFVSRDGSIRPLPKRAEG